MIDNCNRLQLSIFFLRRCGKIPPSDIRPTFSLWANSGKQYLVRFQHFLPFERFAECPIDSQNFGHLKKVEISFSAAAGHGDNLQRREFLFQFRNAFQSFFFRHEEVGNDEFHPIFTEELFADLN